MTINIKTIFHGILIGITLLIIVSLIFSTQVGFLNIQFKWVESNNIGCGWEKAGLRINKKIIFGNILPKTKSCGL